MLDTVSSTLIELDAVTSTRKKDKIKSAYFSLFQIGCILEQPNYIGTFSMPYCRILGNFLLQDVMIVALVKVIFLSFTSSPNIYRTHREEICSFPMRLFH